MVTPNLSRMNFEMLVNLRQRVDARLLECRTQIEKQLERMGTAIDGARTARGRRRISSLQGRKVAPKYRSPSGETWAGRGARPRWLGAAIKDGKKLEDFLIDKSSRRGPRKKRRSKR
jgi:DNA-binding protein H-NS